MAKVKLDPRDNISERALTIEGKRPSFAGVISIRPDASGEPYAAIFPPKRRTTTQRQFLIQLWMKYMAYAYKVTDAFFIDNYRNQALGLWLQPRDIFFAAHAGRLFGFTDENGKKYFSAAARKDMSESLDILAQAPGSILYRNVEYWDGLAPGEPGQVLRIGFGGLPAWSNISEAVSSEARTSGLASQFYYAGQGAGLTNVFNEIRAVRIVGTATSDFTWSVYSPIGAHSALVRLYFRRDGSDGGDYWHGLESYIVKSDGSFVLHSEENRADPAPAPNTGVVYTFELPPFLYDPDRVSLVLVYRRAGAAPDDSNNSNSYLWFWEVYRW